MPKLVLIHSYFFLSQLIESGECSEQGSRAGQEKMVDVPRFELGASSMPRKRASKLRHTPNIQASS